MSRARKSVAKKQMKGKKQPFVEVDLAITTARIPDDMTRAFKNNYYVVMIYDDTEMSNGELAIKALIQRHDDRPLTNHWREIQAIKNEIFGKDVTAIEYYPSENELMDDFNIYWLWIIPNQPIAVLL